MMLSLLFVKIECFFRLSRRGERSDRSYKHLEIPAVISFTGTLSGFRLLKVFLTVNSCVLSCVYLIQVTTAMHLHLINMFRRLVTTSNHTYNLYIMFNIYLFLYTKHHFHNSSLCSYESHMKFI